jgi:hypothetical protein
MAHRGVYRNLPFNFLRAVIAGGFTGFKGFRSGDSPSGKQQMFKKSGFSGLSMTGNSDISDLVC